MAHSRPVLAQAERPRTGERIPSLRRASFAQARAREVGTTTFAFFRLGETSSPERDTFSLKTGARRLSDSSRNQPGQVAANLAQARHACLGEKTRTLHCSHRPTPNINQSSTNHVHNILHTSEIRNRPKNQQRSI